MGAVGIERIHGYPSTMSLDMRTLVEARGGDVEEVTGDMMIEERSVCPPWEDPVTMAVNAAAPVVHAVDRRSIKLLLVATESGLDQEKSLSTWVQRHLDLPDDCRNLEVKHACYGGTGALRLAARFIRPGERALVVCADLSRMHFHKPYEFVMGAGAVAFLVSHEPRFFRLHDDLGGVYTHEVADLTRPTSRIEAGHEETSLLSYIDAVDTTFERYRAQLLRAGVALETFQDFEDYFGQLVYHAPFGGITRRAHRAILRCFSAAKETRRDFAARVEPSLVYARRMGGTYAASTFLSLLALAANGRTGRTGVYSYGSGSCAEFYSGELGPEAPALAREANLDGLLDARRSLTVREYEEAERERSCFIDCGEYQTSIDGFGGWYDEAYRDRGRLVFRGVQDYVRLYEWS